MSPPGEIRVINPASRAVFLAHPTGVFKPRLNTFQYRIDIPGMALSMITMDVTAQELAMFLLNGKPIPVKPAQ